MSNDKMKENVEDRFRFYRSEEVKKYLKKNGVPKSKAAMKALIESYTPNPDAETVESLTYVRFAVHPQQINIWDKTGGKLIISLER